MKIYANQLIGQLKKKLAPIYLISGDEPLLIEEACDQIRNAGIQNQFTERESWQADTNFNWAQLSDALKNLSLFSEKTLLEVRCNLNKLPTLAKQILTEYAENTAPDKILLLISEKLTPGTQNTKWFKSIEKHTLFIQVWPIKPQQLPTWIQGRLRQKKLTAEPNAINFIAEQVEGNLLAANQEIEKLQLLYGSKHLSLDDVMATIGDHARYDIYTLVDSALSGNGKQVLRILEELQGSGTEPTLILWALTREIRTLIDLAQKVAIEKNIEKVLQNQKVWETRKPLVRTALRQHKTASLSKLLQQASQIDQTIKGVRTGNVWNDFTDLCLQLSGINPKLTT